MKIAFIKKTNIYLIFVIALIAQMVACTPKTSLPIFSTDDIDMDEIDMDGINVLVVYNDLLYPVSEEDSHYIANLIKHAEFISDMYKYHYDYELNVGNQIWRYSSDSGAFYSPSEGKSFLINTPEKDKVSAILVKACLNAPVIENTSPVD